MSVIHTTGRLSARMAARPVAAQFGLALALVALTAIAAQMRIPLPFTPVPITLQVLVVLAAGYLLKPVAAAGTMALYLTLGAAGAPLFSSGGAGLGVLTGFTGGYLLACPLAAWTVSVLARQDSGTLRRLTAGVAGLLVIHLAGGSWLAIATGASMADTGLVLTQSLMPFMAVDLAKLAVAEWLTRGHSGR